MIGNVSSVASNADLTLNSYSRKASQGNSQSPADQQQITKLRSIDQKVRQHEQSHLAAAGGLSISGATFQYQRGPDGKNYAVSGEVQIDVSPANSPKETIEKSRRIVAAALAPSDPSSADRAAAAAAAQLAAQAQIELAREQSKENINQPPTKNRDNSKDIKNQKAIEAYIKSAQPSHYSIQAQS